MIQQHRYCLITILLSSRLAEGHTGGEPVERPFPVGCTTHVPGDPVHYVQDGETSWKNLANKLHGMAFMRWAQE